MIRDAYLDIDTLMPDKKVLKLFRAVESQGGVLRFVGGAVRDALMGMKGFDLDLATDLSPEELVEACSENGIKTVPIGIKFGTVGVIINDNLLEVTSLRKDVKTDGRHAEVEFTTDWEEDASRRDLTINAVYADEKGNVFDYYNGISDLENGIVRFIGSASQRVKEDYLRILRFFRFYSIFGKGPIDKKALQACVENREGLKTLSMERLRDEFGKLILTPNVVNTLKIMQDNEILSYILPETHNLDKLAFLIKLVDKEELEHEALRRLFILYEPDVELAENLANRLRMSKSQRQHFVSWAEVKICSKDFFDDKTLRRLVYQHGKDFCIDKMLLQSASDLHPIENLHQRIVFIRDMVVPIFPLRGKDVLAQGVSEPRRIGDILKDIEEIWIASDFALTREELLELVKERNS